MGLATSARLVQEYVEVEVIEPDFAEVVVREKVPPESLGHWLKQLFGMADSEIERIEQRQVGEKVVIKRKPTGQYVWQYGGRI